MNCTTCNAPLESNTRFCPKCGTPVSQAQSSAQETRRDPAASFTNEPQTYPQNPSSPPPTQQQWQPTAPQDTRLQSYSSSPQQPTNLQQDRQGASSLSNPEDTNTRRPRRRRRGCLAGCLITVIVLLLLIGGGWFLVARPYLDNLAQSKLNTALTDAVSHIPPEVAAAPAGPVSIPENLLNNLLVLSSSPNDLVKNMQIHITSNQMRLAFQVYGFSCAVTGVPQVNSGHLTIANVNIEGIAALILTPDEITTLVNHHLTEAQQRINHSIVSVNLKTQELDLVLGQPGIPGGINPPTVP